MDRRADYLRSIVRRCGTPFADERMAMNELATAQQHQARLQEELKSSRECLDIALMDLKESISKVDDRREEHDIACRGLEEGVRKTIELKRKADDAHDRTRSHKDRCWRATTDLVSAEEELNNSFGRLGQLVKETAGATHALSCGVADRDSDEAKYCRRPLT